MTSHRLFTTIAAALLCVTTTAAAQIGADPGNQPIQRQDIAAPKTPSLNPAAERDPALEAMRAQAEKAQRTQNFLRMRANAERLLRLATELKADVDKSTKDEMSLDTIRKAEEVEKLARDIKNRMRGQ